MGLGLGEYRADLLMVLSENKINQKNRVFLFSRLDSSKFY